LVEVVVLALLLGRRPLPPPPPRKGSMFVFASTVAQRVPLHLLLFTQTHTHQVTKITTAATLYLGSALCTFVHAPLPSP
jgi:hypothetical protein